MVNLVLYKSCYTVNYSTSKLLYGGYCIIDINNFVEAIYGPVFKENTLVGVLLEYFPYFDIYDKNIKEEEFKELIDNLKLELKNNGYVVD